jgi:hypothetical protein
MIILTLLLAGTSRATQLVPLTEADLVAQSSLIVIGRCTEVRSAWEGRRLMTLATVAVREVLKGERHPQVTVVIPGGVDAERSVAAVVAGTPQLAPAEEVVLFLTARPGERDRYTVTGWAQGKLAIAKDAAGHEVVGAAPLAEYRARILRRVEGRPAEP